jgi:hypothetical protein
MPGYGSFGGVAGEVVPQTPFRPVAALRAGAMSKGIWTFLNFRAVKRDPVRGLARDAQSLRHKTCCILNAHGLQRCRRAVAMLSTLASTTGARSTSTTISPLTSRLAKSSASSCSRPRETSSKRLVSSRQTTACGRARGSVPCQPETRPAAWGFHRRSASPAHRQGQTTSPLVLILSPAGSQQRGIGRRAGPTPSARRSRRRGRVLRSSAGRQLPRRAQVRTLGPRSAESRLGCVGKASAF